MVHQRLRWFTCFFGLATATLLVAATAGNSHPFVVIIVHAAALAIAARAIDIRRPAALAIIASAGAISALLLPQTWAVTIVTVVLTLLLAFMVILRVMTPFTDITVMPGLRYRVRGQGHIIPDLQVKGIPPRLLRQEILDELADLCEAAMALLERHDIRYVADCGTLLGTIRHSGLIPWDDDVDLRLYERRDRERMERRFDAMRREAGEKGLILFRHGSYWKLARRSFWRYPVVDIYSPLGGDGKNELPETHPWEGRLIAVPTAARELLCEKYGPRTLDEIVHELPFWDSGFVPAMLTRLLGCRLKWLLNRAYALIFVTSSK